MGNFRYNMEHIGDIVVDKLVRCFGSFGTSTRGIVLTYEIRELEKKRKKVLTEIGEKLEEVRAKSPEHAVFNDENMMKLFSTLTSIEDRITACQQEREARLYSRSVAPEQGET